MKQGIYKDISNADYHGGVGVSSSYIKAVLKKSPAHAQVPFKVTPALEFGTCVHSYILEDGQDFAVMPNVDKRTKVGKAKFEAFKAANQGKILISANDFHTIKKMDDAVQAHPAASDLLDIGIAEQSAYWIDVDTGLLCKVRPDWTTLDVDSGAPILVDLKSTLDASYNRFSRDSANYGYHISAAYYLDGMTAATGVLHENFVLIAVEKTEPFGVACYLFDEEAIHEGRKQYRKALEIIADCKKHDSYPAYSQSIEVISLPQYMITEDDLEGFDDVA